MAKKSNKKELYNLSGQFMDLFISDILAKNKVDVNEAKARISDEQREKLKETVENLKTEVEDFLDSNGKKTITEKDQETKKESPLRERFMRKKEADTSNTESSDQEDEKK